MRIALINGSAVPTPPPTYGSEVFTGQLASQLAAHGHEVHLFAPGGSHTDGSVHLHYTPSSQGRIYPGLDRYVVEVYKPILMHCDVIHDLSGSVSVVEALAGEPHTPPLCYTRNGIDFNRPRWHRENGVVLSYAARDCARQGIGAWDQAGPDWAVYREGTHRILEDATVIPYGTNTAFYHPGEKAAIPKTAVYIGRPHPAKGVDYILEIARIRPDWQFILAWRPLFPDHWHWHQTYVQRINEAQTQGHLQNVMILVLPEVGHHTAKRALYQQASVFLQPTRYIEAFGLTAIEAMACGTPVLLADRGSGPEIIGQDPHGLGVGQVLSVDPFHPEEWAEALDQVGDLIREPVRHYAVQYYDIEVATQRYLAFYQAIGGGRAR